LILNDKRIKIFTATTAGISLLLLLFWLIYDPTQHFFVYTPGMDKLTDSVGAKSNEEVKIGENFKQFETYTSALTEKWPGFRGSNHDNILKTSYPINENWNAKPPKIVWTVETGEGHAAPAIYNGLVYFIDYDEKDKADVLKCFSLETGKELWRRWYSVHVKRNHGMSRTIPAVNENYVVTMGPRCHVMCVERLTGNLLWGIDLEKQYKTETPLWYTGQCPIIDNDVAIIGVGGSSLMIGVDCKTGKVLWETPNPENRKMSHSSILPITISGKKMYVYASIGSILGVSAETADAGKLLWQISDWAPSVIAPMPVYLGNNRIFVTGGYGAGGAVIQILGSNGNFSAKLEEKFGPHEGLASEQQTPIVFNGKIYGISPKDAGSNRNQFICYNTTDVRTPVWQSGKEHRYGLGPYMMLNDKFLILSDEGVLTMISAKANGFELINEKKMLEGQDAWGPFAFADGYLILRDSKKIYCVDLK
jgi:outer membrane protein assembly factor BamB